MIFACDAVWIQVVNYILTKQSI